MKNTLAALVVVGAAGCGQDDTATKTVTVPADAVAHTESTPAAGAPSDPESPDSHLRRLPAGRNLHWHGQGTG